jgi:hypothetical protein
MKDKSICEYCHSFYVKRRQNQKYCCINCKQKANRKKYEEDVVKRGNLNQINKGKVGDISELEMSAFYLRNGYEVFRNISQNGPADLIIWKPETGQIHIIDIKSYTELNYVEEFIARKETENTYKEVKVVPYNYNTKEVKRSIVDTI